MGEENTLNTYGGQLEIEIDSVNFSELPIELKHKIFSFDGGGVYALGIFPNLPAKENMEFKILESGRKLRVRFKRELTKEDEKYVGVVTKRSGILVLHLLNTEGDTISG